MMDASGGVMAAIRQVPIRQITALHAMDPHAPCDLLMMRMPSFVVSI